MSLPWIHPQFKDKYTFTKEFAAEVREEAYGGPISYASVGAGYFSGNTIHLDAVQKLWDERNG